MIELYEKAEDCYGCTACMNVCPNNAISMKTDDKGFSYPHINRSMCFECSLCRSVCPINQGDGIVENLLSPDVYAVKYKSDDVRMKSSSGGAFTAISDYILERGGAVYGAGFDRQFDVCHQKAETFAERDKLRGSKYVSSDLKQTFGDIKKELKDKRYVLFTGTPCQSAGLYGYLKDDDTQKLYSCDIICHGTPSPIIWNNYVDFIEARNKSRLKYYSFRCKEIGWRGYNVKTVFENGKSAVNTADNTVFTSLFGSNLAFRPSCYKCRFANFNRLSDITIGDFWGVENCLPDFEDINGISLVLVNTEKGQALFNGIKDRIVYLKSNTADCMQHNLRQPTATPPLNDAFWQDYQRCGFKYVIKKYAGYGLKNKLKRFGATVLRNTGLTGAKVKTLKRR